MTNQENIYSSPKADVSCCAVQKNKFITKDKLTWLISTFVLMFIFGALSSPQLKGTAIARYSNLLSFFAIIVPILWWVKIDSKEMGKYLTPVFSFILFFFAPFVFIYYCFKSRGFVKGILQLAKAFVIVALCIVTLSIANIIATSILINGGF